MKVVLISSYTALPSPKKQMSNYSHNNWFKQQNPNVIDLAQTLQYRARFNGCNQLKILTENTYGNTHTIAQTRELLMLKKVFALLELYVVSQPSNFN